MALADANEVSVVLFAGWAHDREHTLPTYNDLFSSNNMFGSANRNMIH
jgi:hypothetical protein